MARQKWEYYFTDLMTTGEDQSGDLREFFDEGEVHRLGEDGWEYAGKVGGDSPYLFKRPKIEAPATPEPETGLNEP